MFFWLLILFIALPWVELALLFRIGRLVGLASTLLLIIFTGILGATLTRAEGARAMFRVRKTLNEGGLPAAEIVDAFLIFAAGLVLITPGFITDAVGFCLLVPVVRTGFRKLLVAHLKKNASGKVNMHVGSSGAGFRAARERRSSSADEDGAIDVEAHEVDDADDRSSQ